MRSSSKREEPFGALSLLLFVVFFALVGDAMRPPERQWGARGTVAAIDIYRATLSPLFARTHLVVCRFTPSCSLYSREAIRRFGLARGGALSLWRLVRCNPWAKGGFDPVPRAG